MKRFLFVVFVIMVAVFLISCEPKIKEGEVYDKNNTPAHSMMIMMPIVHTTGKTTTTTIIPMWFYYPESWSISYRAFNTKTNKWDNATVWVDRDIYNQVTIGAWYKKNEGDLDEQPKIKQKEGR